MPKRRTLIAFAIVFSLAQLSFAFSAAEIHYGCLDHFDPEDSGLFGFILPLFKQKTGIDDESRRAGHGSGAGCPDAAATRTWYSCTCQGGGGEICCPKGFGVKAQSRDVQTILSLSGRPAIRPASGAPRQAGFALRAIRAKPAPFISRGDNSGTHIAEINLWNSIGIDIKKEAGPWYQSVGQGMGAVLNIAAASGAYTMSDRGTWISFKNRRDLVIAVEGDRLLFNQYGVILVNPARNPHVKKELGLQFIDWLISEEGQEIIASYKIDGEQVFWPQRE